MVEVIILCFVTLVLTDCMTIKVIKDFLFGFLVGQRNRKSAQIIHAEQSSKDKFTMKYIKPMLKQYKKEFNFYSRFYMIVLYTIPISYIGMVIGILTDTLLIIATVFFGIKVIIITIIRGQCDANRMSKYERRRNKKK